MFRVLEEGILAEKKQQEAIINSIVIKKKMSNSLKTSVASMDIDENDDNLSLIDMDSSNHTDITSNTLCVFGMSDYIKSGK